MNFDTAFEKLLGHEGGYVNDPRDPGGETRYGVSKRQYPDVDIKGLTLEGAKAIYRRDYWDKVKGDLLPYPVAFEVFDAAVNHGVERAIEFMQRSLGVQPDGILGPITMGKARTVNPDLFIRRFNGHRLEFFTNLRTWPAFGKGWARRVASNLRA